MAARAGLVTLISQWRSMIGGAGTATVSDDRAQQILDSHRLDFWQEPLAVQPLSIPGGALGSVVYTTFLCKFNNLEGTASGTVAFRLYDSMGSAQSPSTYDMQNGIFIFSADQMGSARYIDGRSYDLNGAAADGWRDLAGNYSSLYDFRQEGRQFSRSQWFKHCLDMADYFDGKKRMGYGSGGVAIVERGDFN
jgi:hypothetical protein